MISVVLGMIATGHRKSVCFSLSCTAKLLGPLRLTDSNASASLGCFSVQWLPCKGICWGWKMVPMVRLWGVPPVLPSTQPALEMQQDWGGSSPRTTGWGSQGLCTASGADSSNTCSSLHDPRNPELGGLCSCECQIPWLAAELLPGSAELSSWLQRLRKCLF